MANPTGKGGFKKGEVSNPNGRPKNPDIQIFRDAMKKVEKGMKLSLYEHTIQRAYVNDVVLIAVLKKILPDMKFIKNDSEDEKAPITITYVPAEMKCNSNRST